MPIQDNTQCGMEGIHKLTTCDVRHPKVKKILDEIQNVFETLKHPTQRHEILQDLYKSMQALTIVNQVEVHNIIPTVGRSVIALWIIGDNTYDAAVGTNYGTLGDDNTAPVNGDTTLGNETYRKATSSATSANNIAYLSNFYTATEVTGTIEEAGWHIDGTGAADSGQLLSHFLTTSITKAATETLTVESTLTIS
jgi:hypothetical protein